MQCKVCKRSLTPLDLTTDVTETTKAVCHESFGFACLSHEGVPALFTNLLVTTSIKLGQMQNQRILLIDDLRKFEGVTKTARTFKEGIRLLKEEKWDEVYLDHDLGSPDPKETGYDILCWLEENQAHLPKNIILVTANPAGAEKMKVVIKKLYGR